MTEDGARDVRIEHLEKNAEKAEKRDEKIFEKLDTLIEDVAGLKVKAGVWGIFGGIIAAIGAFIVSYVKTMPK